MNAPPSTPIRATPSYPLVEGFLPHNCTLPEKVWSILASQWYPVARVDQVQAKPMPVTLLDLRLAVYRMPDAICISRDMCPHRALALTTGRIEGGELVCAYHGLRFGSDGKCRKIPEKLGLSALEFFRMTMFPAVERHGLLWTCLIPQGDPVIPPMRSKMGGDPPFNPVHAAEIADSVEEWIDYFLDAANFPSRDEASGSPANLSTLRHLMLAEYRRMFKLLGLTTVHDLNKSSD